jgi:hypothetical protein
MPRHDGSWVSPSEGRSTGRKEVTGHRAAIDALRGGQPFRGLALAKEQEVSAELAQDGLESLIERNAIRLQTVADLFYDAILCAEQQGKIDTLSRYMKDHARLTAQANTELRALRDMRQSMGLDVVDYERVLEQQRG